MERPNDRDRQRKAGENAQGEDEMGSGRASLELYLQNRLTFLCGETHQRHCLGAHFGHSGQGPEIAVAG